MLVLGEELLPLNQQLYALEAGRGSPGIEAHQHEYEIECAPSSFVDPRQVCRELPKTAW